MEDLFKTYNDEVINKFRKKSKTLILFEELKSIPLNEVQQLYPTMPGKVEFTRISSNNNNLVFTVSMKEGQLWENHNHDCEEIILLYKGSLTNKINNKNIVTAGTMMFKPFQEHVVMANKDSIFYVEFKNPLNEQHVKLDTESLINNY